MTCRECHHQSSCRFNADGQQCYCQCHDVADAAPELLGVARAVMLWAKTPSDHGGNPYCLEFVQLADLAIAVATGEKPAMYHHAWVDTTPQE